MGKRPTVILSTARAPSDLPAALTSLEDRAALTEAAAALCAALGGLHSANAHYTRHARCRARPLPPGAFVGRARSHRHTATAAHAAAAAAAAGQVSGGARALGQFSGRCRFLFVFLWSCGAAVCVWCDF